MADYMKSNHRKMYKTPYRDYIIKWNVCFTMVKSDHCKIPMVKSDHCKLEENL